ncbi:ADP-ribosylhydrolase ARH3-like isoform X2 [Tachypleus tridentatus]|uniref:ADP-ribosylhydrolase ARH3-like isoform X2 n=1 Tax=Tachypleus tridentatus TaxID=6853 RepID=UPI003FD4982E
MSAVSTLITGKFRGCLVGSLLGDCLGAPFEGDFPVSKTVLTKYFTNVLTNESDKGPLKPYTDDTAMTRSVAQSLIERRMLDCQDMAKRFTEEYFKQPKRGYGFNVVDVFKALKARNYDNVFQPAKELFSGCGSYGNGAAMRVAPVALFCYKQDKETLIKMARQSAQITHAHPNGYNGAILQALAVHEALKADPGSNLDPFSFIDSLLTNMESVEGATEGEDEKPYCKSLNVIKHILRPEDKDMTPEEVAVLLGNNISALKSVPTAVYVFLKNLETSESSEYENPFVRTMHFSISLGGDTDTIASMAGSIAGAFYGTNGIPELMQNKCEDLHVSLHLADQLVETVFPVAS